VLIELNERNAGAMQFEPINFLFGFFFPDFFLFFFNRFIHVQFLNNFHIDGEEKRIGAAAAAAAFPNRSKIRKTNKQTNKKRERKRKKNKKKKETKQIARGGGGARWTKSKQTTQQYISIESVLSQ